MEIEGRARSATTIYSRIISCGWINCGNILDKKYFESIYANVNGQIWQVKPAHGECIFLFFFSFPPRQSFSANVSPILFFKFLPYPLRQICRHLPVPDRNEHHWISTRVRSQQTLLDLNRKDPNKINIDGYL